MDVKFNTIWAKNVLEKHIDYSFFKIYKIKDIMDVKQYEQGKRKSIF
jgi:hypothetical protein